MTAPDKLQRLKRILALGRQFRYYVQLDEAGTSETQLWYAASPAQNSLVPELVLDETEELCELAQILEFVVAYEDGQVVDTSGSSDQLPDGLHFLNPRELHVPETIHPRQLREGSQFVAVSHELSPIHPDDARYYATYLRNTGNQPVRIRRFAPALLSSRWLGSQRYKVYADYSDEDFRYWYGLSGTPDDPWILPGQVVFDPFNWSEQKGVMWVYFGEAEDHTEFVAGGFW